MGRVALGHDGHHGEQGAEGEQEGDGEVLHVVGGRCVWVVSEVVSAEWPILWCGVGTAIGCWRAIVGQDHEEESQPELWVKV